MLSIREIARKTGLSTATVSRALNPETAHKVRPDTRAKILAVCEESNFHPDDSARSLATGKTYKVAFIMGNLAMDLGNQLQGIELASACQELQKNGYSMLILGADNETNRNQDIVNILRSNVADAYIMGEDIVSEKIYQAARDCGRPLLVTSKGNGGKNTLTLSKDLITPYREIWKRIPADWSNDDLLFCMPSQEIVKYKSLLSAAPAGRHAEALYLDKSVNIFSFDRMLTRQALAKDIGLLKQKKLIICSSDLTALGVMDLLSEHGRTLGKDYFLIGYDNIEELSGLGERAILSTIDGRRTEYGAAAVQMVLKALQNHTPCETVVFPHKYISRKSFPF